MSDPERQSDESPKSKPEYRAPALDKGLDILEHLAKEPAGQTRAEMVQSMGRSPSEIYRMLQRLVARGYVTRSLEGDRYSLSIKMFVLAHLHPPLRRIIAAAQPPMDRFAEQFEQSVYLSLPDHGEMIVLAQSDAPGNSGMRLRTGSKLGWLDTAAGLTYIAFLEEKRRPTTFARLGMPLGEDDLASHENELLKVRTQGFRIGESTELVGVTDVSAPVIGPDGDAIAVLVCPYMQHKADGRGQSIDNTAEALVQLSEAISVI